jgi:hypothetical protein
MSVWLLICPAQRDLQPLQALAEERGATLVVDACGSPDETWRRRTRLEVAAEVDRIVEKQRASRVAAVLSTDPYPGAVIAAAVASRLGLPHISTAAALSLQHRYVSRLLQQRSVPEAVPKFELLESTSEPELSLAFPCYVRPVKAFVTHASALIDTPEELRAHLAKNALSSEVTSAFDRFAREAGGIVFSGGDFIAEEILPGQRIWVEGAARRGRTIVIGVVSRRVESGLTRFDYPAAIDDSIRSEAERIAARFIDSVGYGDGIFTMEFAADAESGRIGIVDVVPTMRRDFAALHEKVDGTSTWEMLVDVASGRELTFIPEGGEYPTATTFALCRGAECVVSRAPSAADVGRALSLVSGASVAILAGSGERLAPFDERGGSYRYAELTIGGMSAAEVDAGFARLDGSLPFVFGEEADRGGGDSEPPA